VPLINDDIDGLKFSWIKKYYLPDIAVGRSCGCLEFWVSLGLEKLWISEYLRSPPKPATPWGLTSLVPICSLGTFRKAVAPRSEVLGTCSVPGTTVRKTLLTFSCCLFFKHSTRWYMELPLLTENRREPGRVEDINACPTYWRKGEKVGWKRPILIIGSSTKAQGVPNQSLSSKGVFCFPKGGLLDVPAWSMD
jgi:hypothetical protein